MGGQKNRWSSVLYLILCLLLMPGMSQGQDVGVRIKDLARIEGVRNNQLTGYGLVMGLDGTGDRSGTGFTIQSLANVLEGMGITISKDDMSVRNVAAVMVTATLPPFFREGGELDVTISSIGDASSLMGGILLQTPLLAADGLVYAVAQGAVTLGGYGAGAPSGSQVLSNHLTVGRIPNGAIVEKTVPVILSSGDSLKILLHRPDFSTARRLVEAINSSLGDANGDLANAEDAGTVISRIPSGQSAVHFVAELENLRVIPGVSARVVINERTGTIVAGAGVTLQPVAISQGNLNIEVRNQPYVSQPGAFSGGETTVVSESDISVGNEISAFTVLGGAATLGELARALNAMGLSSRDVISIFQALKAAGALQAELVVL
ncbi:MAG: flagellar basal body P-ring protein FlgI [Candidatus Eisenbacteria bacterium]|uniref:Flagellar P-ring protein n=1 Tax=Eiseniibacteriota bacterium TaxID=2212470 RepID=A0A948RXN9_UNCEI|nr:flagellar basal body P-ring protein FlgI [Candidatus Eisenbacteria bacterium]MBU1949316.1 flagellar basal body P-ring protein FlgI [Candidatus Eisenbacteria bacterium]MBU2692943.1 flagellar basal body P-ring protein FlgI [Candidatus Eisenbacteria bacterium]